MGVWQIGISNRRYGPVFMEWFRVDSHLSFPPGDLNLSESPAFMPVQLGVCVCVCSWVCVCVCAAACV